MARGKPFDKGNKAGKGGPRPGAGRPSNAFREACQDIVEREKLLDYVADVAKGNKVDRHVTIAGDVVKVPARTPDRLDAVKFLVEHGHGKPRQSVDVDVTDDTLKLISAVKKARAARGLPL